VKKHAVNNSLTQLKIILIGVSSSELLFPEHFSNISNKILLILARESGGAVQAPPMACGADLQKPKHF